MKRIPRQGFTLIELLIVIAICVCLIALLLPTLGRMKDKSNAVRCISNMKQIGAALLSLSGENNGSIPPVAYDADRRIYWPETVASQVGMSDPDKVYTKRNTIFHCPNHPQADDLPTELASSYMINLRVSSCPPAGITGRPMAAFENPAQTVLLAESTGLSLWINGTISWDPRCFSARHNSLMNLFFLDGHMETHKGPIEKTDDKLFGLIDP